MKSHYRVSVFVALSVLVFFVANTTSAVTRDIYGNVMPDTLNITNGQNQQGLNATTGLGGTTLGSSQGMTSALNNVAGPAQSSSCAIPRDIGGLFDYAICVLGGSVIPFLISIALVIFLAGIVGFVTAGDNEEKRQAGRGMMMFGIIALFVMVSVWGFVNILSNSIFGKNAKVMGAPEKSTNVFTQF